MGVCAEESPGILWPCFGDTTNLKNFARSSLVVTMPSEGAASYGNFST